ncbi:MAG TPA: AMP-binding protein [Steroidobacteraceae bacterium]|nr:AMP-binding protein [Steroidobacteraceae bacterium]
MSSSPLYTATTLTALIESLRENSSGGLHYHDSERETRRVSFAELYQRALGILYHLQRLGARPGDKLILLLSGNEPFIDAFWAAMLGGIVPVPIAPGISDEHRHKLLRIARKLHDPFIYTEQRLLERVAVLAAASGEAARTTFEALRARAFLVDQLHDISRAGKLHRALASDTAFIQFSSGSTSEPKGVVLTHANLLANIRAIGFAAGLNASTITLSWMPLTHDMGLIGFHLVLLGHGANAHLMPTELFVRRPLLWLALASRVRATMLCSPNFGYRHYLKMLGERRIEDLDLSSVQLIYNGAEPISVDLMEEFLSRTAPARLARNAMFPVYGLAEASLAVSFPQPGAPSQVLSLNRHQLNVGEKPQTDGVAERDVLRLVGVGRAVPYCELRITDDRDLPLGERQVGHIQIRGDNVTGGYFEDPELNRSSFSADGWLRTGDLGLIHRTQLYITGRHKEILFVNGQNYYPHDLEGLLEQVEGLELGKVVVAGVRPPGAQEDELLVFVLHRGTLADFMPLAREVARRIAESAGLEVSAVIPVKRIPKTTSGKIQRHALETEYLTGAFAAELAQIGTLRATQAKPAVSGSDIEQALRDICEQELEGRSIDRDESLFDIGASSIKLLAIHQRLEQQWPGRVDVTDIFDHPSIAALARFIEQSLTVREQV